MAAPSTYEAQLPRLTLKTFLTGVAALTVLCVGGFFLAGVLYRYSHFDAGHYGGLWTARWWLVAHLGGGSLALALGPLQFVNAIRKRYSKAHRWIGRVYLLGIAAGSVAAFYMSVAVAPSPAFGTSLFFLGVAWVTTSLMGYIAAVRKQFAIHREWMIL